MILLLIARHALILDSDRSLPQSKSQVCIKMLVLNTLSLKKKKRVSTVSPFQFLDKNDYYLAYQPQERESTRVGEGSTVYSCYDVSDNRI